MRVAVLADIHGNLAAAEAVMEDIERQAPDFVVAAGDLAMRGSHPAETFDLLADRCDAMLMGNTDAYLADLYLAGAYRETEHWKTELLMWTRQQLGPARLAQMAQLAFSTRYSPRKGQDLFVCHANPKNLEESIEPTLDAVGETAEAITARTARNATRDAFEDFLPRASDLVEGLLRFGRMDAEADRLDL